MPAQAPPVRRSCSAVSTTNSCDGRCPTHRGAGLRQYLGQVGSSCANQIPLRNAQQSRSAASGDATSRCPKHGRHRRVSGPEGRGIGENYVEPSETAMPGHVLRQWRAGARSRRALRSARASVSSPANALQHPSSRRGLRSGGRGASGLGRRGFVRRYQPIRPMTDRGPATYGQSAITHQPNTDSKTESRKTVSLTPAETRVLTLLPRIERSPRSATQLSIGRPTVKTHVANIYKKLGATKRAEAVKRAESAGLLPQTVTKIGIGRPSVKTHVQTHLQDTRMTYHDDSR